MNERILKLSKKIMTYTEYRLAKRNGEIIQQKRNKTITIYTKWWNPLYYEHDVEYSTWLEIPFVEVELETA